MAQFQSNRVNPSSRKGEKGERAAVDGRRHRDMQTDKWLEEIKDRVPEVEIGVQGRTAHNAFSDVSFFRHSRFSFSTSFHSSYREAISH